MSQISLLDVNTTKLCAMSSTYMNGSNNCTAGKIAAAEYFESVAKDLSLYVYLILIDRRFVLKQSDSFENFGTPTWKLSLSLFLAWVLVYICIFKGIKSSGKVSGKSYALAIHCTIYLR